MITRLDLEDYGKFKKASLNFGPFTVVTGANEAGKTTVFDALFDALCGGSRHEGRPVWKRLADRYGALRRAVLTWEGEPFSFDYSQFLEIFAIRGGDTSTHAANGGTWAAEAEARLLNSGLNPAGLAAALIDKAESNRKGTAQARLKELRKIIKEREPEIAALKARRDAIFAGEADTVRLEADLKEKSAALTARQAELTALNAQAEALAEACRLQAALEGIKALRDHKEAADALAPLAAYEKNEIVVYRALAAEQREREGAVAAAEAGMAERRAASASARTAAGQLAEREPVLKRQAETAQALLAKLAAFAAAPPKVIRTLNKPMRLGIWAGALALAAFVAFSGRSMTAYIAAAAIVGAGAWVGLKLSVKETLIHHTPEEEKAFMSGLGVEWAMVSPDPLPADMEAARSVFARPAAEHAALVEAYNGRAAEITELEAGVAMLEENLVQFKRAAQAARATAEGWLRERGCATEDEYQARIAGREKLLAREGDLRERLKIFKLRYGCESDEQLKDKFFAEKEALDRKGVDPAAADEPELDRLKQRIAAVAADAHNMEVEAAGVTTALKTAQAVAGAKLEALPEQINRLDNEVAAANEEIAAIELQVQAYMLAAEVFNKLAEKSTVAFETLAKEVAEMVSGALPGAQAEFVSFDAEEAGMKDAGGKVRPVSQLSSGTRDLFMLGARLVMAKKARQGADGTLAPALLVLDDPFYTLDHDRQLAAVRLLVAFRRETNWQIILLTKDIALAQAALATAVPIRITELK